jgi:hypothetical protein
VYIYSIYMCCFIRSAGLNLFSLRGSTSSFNNVVASSFRWAVSLSLYLWLMFEISSRTGEMPRPVCSCLFGTFHGALTIVRSTLFINNNIFSSIMPVMGIQNISILSLFRNLTFTIITVFKATLFAVVAIIVLQFKNFQTQFFPFAGYIEIISAGLPDLIVSKYMGYREWDVFLAAPPAQSSASSSGTHCLCCRRSDYRIVAR